MAKVALNIAKSYNEGFIAEMEKTKYFQLHKNAATRVDLYNFAIALGIIEEKSQHLHRQLELLSLSCVQSILQTTKLSLACGYE